jgi:hypothetical protein
MIPYEELVAALDRYVARKSGASVPAARAASASPRAVAPAPAVSFDEAHDPDLPPLAAQHEEDSTHVGSAAPGARPPSLVDHEIDIGDVLSDEEL